MCVGYACDHFFCLPLSWLIDIKLCRFDAATCLSELWAQAHDDQVTFLAPSSNDDNHRSEPIFSSFLHVFAMIEKLLCMIPMIFYQKGVSPLYIDMAGGLFCHLKNVPKIVCPS